MSISMNALIVPYRDVLIPIQAPQYGKQPSYYINLFRVSGPGAQGKIELENRSLVELST